MTWIMFFLATLASLGIHRIWNYESIMLPLRTRASKAPGPLGVLLGCPPCNALWIALGTCTLLILQPHPAVMVVFSALAIYPIIRSAIWIITMSGLVQTKLQTLTQTVLPWNNQVIVPPVAQPVVTAQATLEAEKDRHTEALTYEKRVVILTMLHTFESSYSLTSVILDQARMLATNPRWLIELWVTNTCRDTPELPANVRLRRVVPPVMCAVDQVVPQAVTIVADRLRAELIPLGNAVVITHDLLFVSQFLNYAAAIHSLGKLRGFSWLHICHSGPGTRPTLADDDQRRFRYTLPEGNHTVVALSASHIEGMRRYYLTDRVMVIPNTRDPLTMDGLVPAPLTKLIQEGHLAEAEVVQVYPVSTTRFEGKGMTKLLRLFAEMAKGGAKVRLVVCNPHANDERGKGIVAQTRQTAVQLGLPPECLIFTSETLPDKAAVGLPSSWVSTLFRYSNLFAFPTRGEASSLVLYEAVLHGCLLVLNSDVPALKDALPSNLGTRFCAWGTGDEDHSNPALVARGILDDLAGDPREQAKRFVLKARGLHSLQDRWEALVTSHYPGSTPT